MNIRRFRREAAVRRAQIAEARVAELETIEKPKELRPAWELVQIGTALPMLDHSGARWMFCAEGSESGIPIFIKGGVPDERQ